MKNQSLAEQVYKTSITPPIPWAQEIADAPLERPCAECRAAEAGSGPYCESCRRELAHTGQLVAVIPLDGSPVRVVRWTEPVGGSAWRVRTKPKIDVQPSLADAVGAGPP